ncbi:UNVERIFIED_CONTAM: Ufl1 [Trichonephila clavipes]
MPKRLLHSQSGMMIQRSLTVLMNLKLVLCDLLVFNFVKPVTKRYQEVAKALYDSTVASAGSSRRKQYSDYQEKLSSLLGHIVMFERAIKLFSAKTKDNK